MNILTIKNGNARIMLYKSEILKKYIKACKEKSAMLKILNKMFSEEEKKTRTRIRIIATMLIITLTFANVVLLATYMGEGRVAYRSRK